MRIGATGSAPSGARSPGPRSRRPHVFDAAEGKRTLADLFDRRSQLVIKHLMSPRQKEPSPFLPRRWDHRGGGFGVPVVIGRGELWATPEGFGWDGGYGTSGASDPKEETVAILMTRRARFPLFSGVYRDFWTAAYQAIGD